MLGYASVLELYILYIISTLLESITTESSKLLIVGDFNIHWDVMHNRERKQLADLFDRYNLKQYVQSATQLAGHILNLVISGVNDDLVMACETDSLLSDHHVVHCKLKIG